MTGFKENDIVKVVHYESKFAGVLGEIREFSGDSAYVEFNDANGESRDGQIISLSWLEWVYSPNASRLIAEVWDEAYNWGLAVEGSGGDEVENPYR